MSHKPASHQEGKQRSGTLYHERKESIKFHHLIVAPLDGVGPRSLVFGKGRWTYPAVNSFRSMRDLLQHAAVYESACQAIMRFVCQAVKQEPDPEIVTRRIGQLATSGDPSRHG